jgi:tRNA U34 5-methylaminomethyl-2-thiouridine-forming methyltransferase MnmC
MNETNYAPQLQLTKDGSHTLFNDQINESYHSSNGALQESLHVFIEAGLKAQLENFSNKSIQILELGFGTGLNAILSYIECNKHNIACGYNGIECYPLGSSLIEQLNYSDWMNEDEKYIFKLLHTCNWNEKIDLNDRFSLQKIPIKIEDIANHQPSKMTNYFDLVYMDAFDPAKQPELWKVEVFITLYQIMKDGAYIVTYSSKGDVKRAMREAGFKVERLPGPIGKRHMLRGRK